MQGKWQLGFLIGAASLASCSTILGANPYLSEQAASRPVSPASLTPEVWSKAMMHVAPSRPGCFQARYPHTALVEVQCKPASSRPFSSPSETMRGRSKVVGGGLGYVLRAPTVKAPQTNDPGGESAFLTKTVGLFLAETGIQSVITSGTGYGSGLGQYSLQINTNADSSSAACAPYPNSNCSVWQQFVYSTSPVGTAEAGIFMEYWLLKDTGDCPSGWYSWAANCWMNTRISPAPVIPVTDLEKVQLWATATKSGVDGVRMQYKDGLYDIYADDGVLDITQAWKESEFNIFGNGSGSEALFLPGASLTVRIGAFYKNLQASTRAPDCVKNAGTTAETNSLTVVGPCLTASYGLDTAYPYIQFTESAVDPPRQRH